MLQILFPAHLAKHLVTSVVDNVIRDKVSEPAIGSIVYCDLVLGVAEHSGIYIGGNEIIHLNRHGMVERVSPAEFIDGTTALSIYVSCLGPRPVGSNLIASRAKYLEANDKVRSYGVLLNNCHQFSSACVTGAENSQTFLWMLKDSCSRHMGADAWRVWDRGGRSDKRLNPEPSLVQLERLPEVAASQIQGF